MAKHDKIKHVETKRAMSENEGKAYNKNKEYNCMLQKFTKESICVLSYTLSLIIHISVTIRERITFMFAFY